VHSRVVLTHLLPTTPMKWRKHDPMHPSDTVFLQEQDELSRQGKEDRVVWVVKGKLPIEEIDKICEEGLGGYDDRGL
jgi:hypothetical protein